MAHKNKTHCSHICEFHSEKEKTPMKKVISVLGILLALAVLLSACVAGPEPTEPPTSAPTTEPTEVPTTEPTVPPTTEPPTEPPTEATEPPRQEGERLSVEELELFEGLFHTETPYAWKPINYYAMAACVEFDTPENLNLLYYFNLGFEQAKEDPITDEERSFYLAETGFDGNTLGDIYRLPASWVNGILQYYFGVSAESVTGWSGQGWAYNEGTDCYYISPPGALMAGRVLFHDGYYDEATGVISLYYYNRDNRVEWEYVIRLQSKAGLHKSGYYILSNLPVAE